MKKRFLLVIDMLNDFVDPKGALYIGPTALPVTRNIRELVRDFDGQKYFLCDSHTEGDKEFERFPKHAITGSWGQAIIEGLVNIAAGDKIIPKTRYNGFYHTNLERDLLLRGYNPTNSESTVVGVCSSICVMDTVGWLANMDYSINVPRNCIADFDPSMHEFAMKRMETLYGANLKE